MEVNGIAASQVGQLQQAAPPGAGKEERVTSRAETAQREKPVQVQLSDRAQAAQEAASSRKVPTQEQAQKALSKVLSAIEENPGNAQNAIGNLNIGSITAALTS